MRTHADDADRLAKTGLWDNARHLLDWLAALFGGPSDVADLGLITRREHAEIACWLRPVEALVRRLLLIEASRLRKIAPAFQSQQKRRCRSIRARRIGTTCAPFRVCPRAPHEDGRRTLHSVRGNDLLNAAALAGRIAAVARVIDNPAPYARRLAQKLAATPEHARRIAPHTAQRHGRPGLGDWALAHAAQQTESAAIIFDTS